MLEELLLKNCKKKIFFSYKTFLFREIQTSKSTRQCVRVKTNKTGKEAIAMIPLDGRSLIIDVNDSIVLEGIGRNGKSLKDLPGVKYKVLKVSGISLETIQYNIDHPKIRIRR